ncbi:GNAT family N-acetyltransferase [Lapillicoccus jejuensis]|uniref:FR47-like protein n=1 Tax=Lapillicoccus jejuensis TaxID=402171 RepID=A0A542DYS8_9MICO|nr:GNAT family N-acetyltransferase [Lapillicoccus jejuensis]TQJ08253.1 FR47-like protein [Lapillicoccus jejuensis]
MDGHGGRLRVTFHDDPAAFLSVAGPVLGADPVTGTVVATIAQRVAHELAGGVDSWEAVGAPFARWWATVHDVPGGTGPGEGPVVGVAMRTAGFERYPAFLLPMPDDAARVLAREVHDRGEELRGLNGALPAVRVCAEETARLLGGSVHLLVRTRLFEARHVDHPAAPDGSLSLAGPGDLEVCAAWFAAFHADADRQAGRRPGEGGEHPPDRDDVARRIERGTVALWRDGQGRPVHLTGWNPPAFGVARIGPVYTPAEHRGRGYAAAAVAATTQRFLDDGVRVCLFTDQANPVSNALYERLGYRPVTDMAQLVVE